MSKQFKNDDFWVPFNSENHQFLQIGNINNHTDPSVSISDNYFTERMAFWNTNVPV